jgi:hypothetical protein
MIRTTAALAMLCFTAPVAAPLVAQSFEGSVTMNMTDNSGMARSMTFLLKGGKMRFDPPGGQLSVIIDPATQRMMVLVTAQHMYMESNFADAAAAAAAASGAKMPASTPSIVKTGKTDMVAGYKCEDVSTTDDDGKMLTICLSSELGGFRLPAASNPMAPQHEANWLSQLGMRDFPLRVTKDGKTVMEVTAIEKKSLDAAMFAVPDGYQSFSMPVRKKPGDN